jgi:hypothetical protein
MLPYDTALNSAIGHNSWFQISVKYLHGNLDAKTIEVGKIIYFIFIRGTKLLNLNQIP